MPLNVIAPPDSPKRRDSVLDLISQGLEVAGGFYGLKGAMEKAEALKAENEENRLVREGFITPKVKNEMIGKGWEVSNTAKEGFSPSKYIAGEEKGEIFIKPPPSFEDRLGATLRGDIQKMQTKAELDAKADASKLQREKANEKFTEGQYVAATYANRAINAQEIFDKLEDQKSGFDPANMKYRLAAKTPFGLGNMVMSAEERAYDNAKRDFMAADLRKQSGASISPSEYENEDQIYFPQPGDGPKEIAAKRAKRQAVIDGYANQASGALAKLRAGSQQGSPPPEPESDRGPSIQELQAEKERRAKKNKAVGKR